MTSTYFSLGKYPTLPGGSQSLTFPGIDKPARIRKPPRREPLKVQKPGGFQWTTNGEILSYHQHPAIDVECLSRDDGRFPAGEIHDEKGDLVWFKAAADRCQACLEFRDRLRADDV
jgi:hypothetical protein